MINQRSRYDAGGLEEDGSTLQKRTVTCLKNVVSIQSSQDRVRNTPDNEFPDLCKDIFLTSRMTFIFPSRTLLDVFRFTFPNPRASAVVIFYNARLYKNGLYIVYVYLSQNEVH